MRLAREALHLVRVGADSPPETELRLALIEAGLPEPELQVPGDPQDRFARIVDLGYRAWRLALQYDGEHHRSREQQARDARRDGWLQDHGWRSLRLTADDRLTGFARAIESVRLRRGEDRSGERVLPRPVECREPAALRHELRRAAVLDDAAVVHHEHAVGDLHGAQPMRDDQRLSLIHI